MNSNPSQNNELINEMLDSEGEIIDGFFKTKFKYDHVESKYKHFLNDFFEEKIEQKVIEQKERQKGAKRK